MLSHETVWAALDAMAQKNQLSPSGLALKSGLDATSFNKSKRVTAKGRPRWPSTESLAKALRATDTSFEEFVAFVRHSNPQSKGRSGHKSNRALAPRHVPLLGLAQAGAGGFFDDGGFPAGQGWDEIPFPAQDKDGVYALEVSGDSMQPLYRDGDIVIVAPAATVRKGDRVVVKTIDGEVMAKTLSRQNAKTVELTSINPKHPDRKLNLSKIEWIARILWASQ